MLMVTIAITSEAFAAIVAMLPDRRKAAVRREGSRGRYVATLPNGVLDRLKALRGPGESYSEVIIRLAKAG